MTSLDMVIQFNILMFIGWFLLGFVGGYVYACNEWSDD